MSNEEIIEPREYPLPGSTPWYNKRAREESERAIGSICMAFQRLEELVSDHIGRLISDDGQLGTIITAELSFRNRVGLLCSLCAAIRLHYIGSNGQCAECLHGTVHSQVR